jgi:acylphosphatase
VGFRTFVQSSAEVLDLSGWVRNRFNGTVEVTAEGPRPALERLLKALHTGPRAAQVTGVAVEWSSAGGGFAGFNLRRTD